MTHPNVGFKDALLEELPGGQFRLIDPTTNQPFAPIVFHNRKAVRNWARGRGLRLLDDRPERTRPAFPAPL